MSDARLDPGPAILPALARRWSPRAFADRPVPPDTLRTCLEAMRWAASSYNEQPWTVLVGDRAADPDTHARLADCLTDLNRTWAPAAPVLMLTVAKQTFSRDGKPNRCAPHDVGLATAGLMVQAAELGLATHAMAGFSRTRARDAFGIPDGHEPMAALALGYPGDAASLEDPALREMEKAPRPRRPLAQWVFGGVWGAPAAAVLTTSP